jgi:choline dehydrogenase-like flavoprotein
MAQIIGKGKKSHTYDAIVIGSGISGGWAAKELTEKGLTTLVLERGRNIEHIKDYPTAFKDPWDFAYVLQLSKSDGNLNPVNAIIEKPAKEHFVLDRKDHPYKAENPFSWVRGYQLGGRSLTWGRNCYRWSDLDFEANLRDGVAVDWPIRYKDIAPWYSYVEKYIGLSGRKEGLAHLPDGEFLPEIGFNAVEEYFAEQLSKSYNDRILTPARTANLTVAHQGRGPCQFRNMCARGCPFKGYFCSITSTLPAAEATGKLSVRPFSVVTEVLLSKEGNKAIGVRVVDAITKETTEFFADIIFLNASTINTAAIMLNSKSAAHPDGIGNYSGQLGRNLMDHFTTAGAEGEIDILKDKYFSGRSPGSVYLPRFRNINDATRRTDFIRGYSYQGKGERVNWTNKIYDGGFGADYKSNLLEPGPWRLRISGFGETLPYEHNRLILDDKEVDEWGMPIINISFKYGENEKAMRKDMKDSASEMMEACGFKVVSSFDYELPGGSAAHEMGTARMGHDRKTSVLNANNQVHGIPNLFVTDGSCMTSAGTQNPSITYMALTARAVDFAVKAYKKGSLT